ncbi:MAG: hypothetical protein KDD38_06375 [Bdellovibrionales bacterium]|nr:hypothetical protein [Bdellovibrionales bacterium]
MRIIMVAICLYMLWGHSANAQNTISLPISELATHNKKKLTIDVEVSLESNLRESSDPEYAASSYLDIAASYKVFAKASISAQAALEQALYADQETSISNTILSLNRDPINIADNRKLNISTFTLLPTNEKDRIENSLRSAFGLTTGISQKFSLFNLPSTASYSLSYLQNFHEFERTNLRGPNLDNRVRHTLGLIQNLPGKVTLSLIGRYQTGWTYQGALKTSFLLSEELAFDFNKTGQVYVAHTNNGDALGANGVDSNISIYDKSNSAFSTGLRVQY